MSKYGPEEAERRLNAMVDRYHDSLDGFYFFGNPLRKATHGQTNAKSAWCLSMPINAEKFVPPSAVAGQKSQAGGLITWMWKSIP